MGKCLITGISGFLAGYIAEQFKQKGYEIVGIHHSIQKAQNRADRYYRIHLPHEDIYDVIKLEKPDIIVHAAGTASVPYSMDYPYIDFSISVPATAIVLDAIRQKSPETRFIFLSSAAVYGNPAQLPIKEDHSVNPISPYGYHKLMGELLCNEYRAVYGLDTKIARIFSAYGAGLDKQVIFDLMMKFLREEGPVRLYGTGKESRDFIHAKDVARAIRAIDQAPIPHHIFNVASGNEITIAELAKAIKHKCGSSKDFEFNNKTEPGKPNNWVADIQLLDKIGGAPEITLSEGLEDVFDYSKQLINNP
jgi:UDP-glucose 4-epimerase